MQAWENMLLYLDTKLCLDNSLERWENGTQKSESWCSPIWKHWEAPHPFRGKWIMLQVPKKILTLSGAALTRALWSGPARGRKRRREEMLFRYLRSWVDDGRELGEKFYKVITHCYDPSPRQLLSAWQGQYPFMKLWNKMVSGLTMKLPEAMAWYVTEFWEQH